MSQHPQYLVRAIGPALVACDSEDASISCEGKLIRAVTKVTCFLHDNGKYHLSVLLTYAKKSLAYPAPPACATACVCKDLAQKPQLSFFVRGPRSTALPMSSQHDIAGRWVCAHDCLGWRWQPFDRSLDDGLVWPKNTSCPKVWLIGDSHSRNAAEYLRVHGYEAERIGGFFGIKNHQISSAVYENAVEDAKKHTCNKTFYEVGRGPQSVRSFLLSQLRTLGNYSEQEVFVLNAGTWDLRDDSIDTFAGDLEELVPLIENLQRRGARVVIRTAPPWSYKHTDRLGGRDMRTNEKLRQARDLFVHFAHRLDLPVWDSFSILLPRFMESEDTHHYIKNSSGSSAPGVADVWYLMNMVCGGEAH